MHQDASLDELQRVHDRFDLVAAHLFGPAPLVQRGDRALLLGIGLVTEYGSEIAVEPVELSGDRLLRLRVPGRDPLGALLPQVADEQLEHLIGLARGH